MVEALLTTQHLHKAFGALQVTRNINLTLFKGEIHALIGPNGAGKTTLLAQLSGQLKPDSGHIIYRNKQITTMPMHRRAKQGIARSFQITAVMSQFSVQRNVMLAVQARARHHFHMWHDVRSDAALVKEAEAVLNHLALQEVAYVRASQLSHGQKRQLELAMALATQPQVLLLDEPMAGMGTSETAMMTEVIRELKQDHAVLLIEHDMDVVFELADRISVLVYGEIIASGPPAQVRTNPAVQAAYLGVA